MIERLLCIAALVSAGCTLGTGDHCYGDDDQPVACEPLEDVPELPDAPDPPDDLAELGRQAADASPGPSTAIDWGLTRNAERRRFLPIGRTQGARRYVVMRLRPSDLPRLRAGDRLRAAAELQVTTRCDIGQVAPGCGYAPRVRLQLVLADDPEATNPHAPGVLALSGIEKFDCTADDHHCVKVIDFAQATAVLRASRAPCIADDSCFVNLVAWAYHPDARRDGKDRLLLGANEGNFLDNGDIEQDRGRIMAVRERDLSADDVSLRVTSHDVRNGPIELASNGDWHRIYSHALKAGHDLHAGEKFRVWADVEATSNHRVNLSLLFFLTRNRDDHDGGGLDAIRPNEISEHNGTNCSPGNPCHLRKVAVFEVERDLAGPVYLNLAASTEVPGPGSAITTIQDRGFVKAIRYAR